MKLLFIIVPTLLALNISIPQNEKFCITEEVAESTLLLCSYQIVSSRYGREYLEFTILGPDQTPIFSRTNESSAKYSETSFNGGTYSLCFENTSKDKLEVSFDFKKGVSAKDYSTVASTKDLRDVDLRLRKITDSTTEIHKSI